MSRLFCFCGTGGTGKTVTLEALKRKRPEFGYFSSISREYYAKHGITSQQTATEQMNPRQHFDFQLGMLQYYVESTRDRLAGKSGVAVFERSVVCHAAYCIESYPLMDHADYLFITGIVDMFLRDFKPTIFYFPYPCSWTGDPNTDDGFRVAGPVVGKNLILNSLMLWMLNVRRGLFVPVPEGRIESRADMISTVIGGGGGTGG